MSATPLTPAHFRTESRTVSFDTTHESYGVMGECHEEYLFYNDNESR